MNRVIDIQRYWASVVKNSAEFQQIAIAENPEFNLLIQSIRKALDEKFIQSASEDGVARWESIIGIVPAEGDTLDDRKTRILTYLTLRRPYTWRTLQQVIASVVGDDNFEVSYKNDKAELWIGLNVTDEQVIASLKDLLNHVLPLNIVAIYYSLIYDKCKTVADMIAVNPDYKNHLDNGVWRHKLSSLDNMRDMFMDNVNLKRFEAELPLVTKFYQTFKFSTIEQIKLILPKLTYAFYDFGECKNLVRVWLDMPNCVEATWLLSDSTTRKIYLNCPKLQKGSRLFNATGKCEEYNIPCGFPELINGDAMFTWANLKSIPWKFPKLQNANTMFYQSKLQGDIEVDFPELTTATTMFYDTRITSFKGKLPKLTNGYRMFRQSSIESFESELPELTNATEMFVKTNITTLNTDFPKVTNGYCMFTNAFSLQGDISVDFSSLSNASQMFYGTKVTSFNCDLPKCTRLDSTFRFVTTITSLKIGNSSLLNNIVCICEGCTNLVEFEGDVSHVWQANLAFKSCKLNKTSALNILNNLREKDESVASGDTFWNISIGIHVDHKTDEEVLQAIANAEAKGWELTVQWNGTPTSGIALLDMDFIYAKRTQNDEGSYIDENGTRWDVDYGHYVTGSDYTEYNSEEEALAGLTFCGSMLPEPEMEEELTHE